MFGAHGIKVGQEELNRTVSQDPNIMHVIPYSHYCRVGGPPNEQFLKNTVPTAQHLCYASTSAFL